MQVGQVKGHIIMSELLCIGQVNTQVKCDVYMRSVKKLCDWVHANKRNCKCTYLDVT
jgi:hypothetical protein